MTSVPVATFTLWATKEIMDESLHLTLASVSAQNVTARIRIQTEQVTLAQRL